MVRQMVTRSSPSVSLPSKWFKELGELRTSWAFSDDDTYLVEDMDRGNTHSVYSIFSLLFWVEVSSLKGLELE